MHRLRVAYDKMSQCNAFNEVSVTFSLETALIKNNRNSKLRANTEQKHRTEKENSSEEDWRKPSRTKFFIYACSACFSLHYKNIKVG